MKIGLCKKDCRIKQHFTLESDNFIVIVEIDVIKDVNIVHRGVR